MFKQFLHRLFLCLLLTWPGVLPANTKVVPPAHLLRGHVPAIVSQLNALGQLPADTNLNLCLGVPLRNTNELETLLAEQQNPASTNYHRWLTPAQFTGRFGPTEQDYQKVVNYAQRHGFKVTKLYSNRMMVNVEAPVAEIEKTFNLKLHWYRHPGEGRNFFAPDTDPTIETNVPILHIAGLDNYVVPRRLGGALKITPLETNTITDYATGSSPGGFFMGSDFRNAYVPGVTNTGAGQYIAIVDVGGPYYPLDVYMYQTNAGLSTNIVVTNIITTFTSYWTNALTGSSTDEGEEVLDIDMAMSMAPDAVILNYEGEAHDVFNQIAVDNLAKQMTLSYGFGIDSIIQQIFQQFVAQGQAMSQASGDGGADLDGGTGLTGAPYSTIVGGVSLTTSGTNGPWLSDPTWGGSGGGISGWGIPFWQQGINMATNLGSTSYRNYPDVAMPADNIFTVYKNGTVVGGTGGTSAASPLWAGFMALVNQQAATQGNPAVGFINPAIYAIGKGPRTIYTNCFHDITAGNTFNNHNPLRYAACPGYDLCTGWGTPTGSNTINALVGVGTNDFTFYVSRGVFNLVAGGSASASITMTRMNGLAGSAFFSVSGLPEGVTATMNPVSTTTSTTMVISTLTNTVPGTYTATLTGAIGGLTHTESSTLVINPTIPGATPVSLTGDYNRTGFYTDGQTFGIGVDGSYSAYSATLLGSSLSWNGLVFNLGPANAPDVAFCAGQVINLPAGQFNTLQLLATGVQGNQTAQTFIVTYTDNSTTMFTQSFSDWASPQSYSGENTVITMPYRNLNSGSSQALNVTVDGYVFMLNETKTVKSITLPNNSNVVILSMMLAKDPVGASLANYYNRAGIYSDGTTFTNPATGGLDGGGAAYSGTLLGGSTTWSNVVFNFGPINATNIISAAGQTIVLPSGNYSRLLMLATGVQGGQTSQPFLVTYADASTTTFVQSLSDWYSPQNYAGESEAIVMGHRDSADGMTDNRTFYLYGYSFALNPARTLQSIRLPINANVIVTAISLVPNWEPTFAVNPFSLPSITAGQKYSGTIATNASDLNGDVLTFAKVGGPAWLNVAGNGTLFGTPLSPDAGSNSFVVSVTDPGNLSATATLNLNVQPAPPIQSSVSTTGSGLQLNWSGGIGPYQVQTTTNLSNPDWQNVGGVINANTLFVTPNSDARFYRIIGQ